MFNQTLINTYAGFQSIPNRFRDRVKAIMGWKTNQPFYERLKGRVPCTIAERNAFTQAAQEMKIEVPADLFPANEQRQPASVE